MKPGDLVRFKTPGELPGAAPAEDNSAFTLASIKDGVAYWDEGPFRGYAPITSLVLVAEYTDLDGEYA
jgi:hypothetical protein